MIISSPRLGIKDLGLSPEHTLFIPKEKKTHLVEHKHMGQSIALTEPELRETD